MDNQILIMCPRCGDIYYDYASLAACRDNLCTVCSYDDTIKQLKQMVPSYSQLKHPL